jgi:hypothetical protein
VPRKKPIIPHGVLDPTPEEVRFILAKNVKKCRIEKKLSQQRLADLAWEKGQSCASGASSSESPANVIKTGTALFLG